MIRLTLLGLIIVFLAIYSWRDWYVSLCGLVVLMAVIEHPDMPKTILGIQGLNPWNFLLLFVLMAWNRQRHADDFKKDMPRNFSILLKLYMLVVLIGFARLMSDKGPFQYFNTSYLISEYLVNTLKWTLPGMMFFYGCRSIENLRKGIIAILLLYILLGLQVIKWMPMSAAVSGGNLSERSLKILLNEVGYHRVNLSMMLAGASWAIFSTKPLMTTRTKTVLILLISLIMVYAQALTAGRMGYVTWMAVGLVLCLLRWRKYLLFAPFAILFVVVLIPGTMERLTQGFSPESRDGNPLLSRQFNPEFNSNSDGPDEYTVTAGRNVAWPYVIEKIKSSPWIGYGREAMSRTGISGFLWNTYRESFPHPHNAYLEMLLDNGIIGFLAVMPFYFFVLKSALSLFRDSSCPYFIAVGGLASSLVLAMLVASFGSQTFYPREGAVGMWCAIGLMLRVRVEREKGPDGMFNAATGNILHVAS